MSLNSPYFAGWPRSRSWIATFAPSSASRSAITRPRPRPDPVTNAVLPVSSPIVVSYCMMPSARMLAALRRIMSSSYRSSSPSAPRSQGVR